MVIEEIIISFSYIGIFLLMVSNGLIGIFPSSQITFLIMGYLSYEGYLNLYLTIFIGGLGMSCGNMILYEISRRKGLDYISKFKLFPKKEIQKVQIAFKKKGIWFLVIGKLINPIRIFISIPAGIAKVPRLIFFSIVWLVSTIYVGIFATLGFYFGKSFEMFGFYIPLILIIAFLVMYWFYKYSNSEEVLKELDKN
jgi:membrane protein DedA with SNARE-associated domain